MAESIEVELEELTGSDLNYWSNQETFSLFDAKFLINDCKPKPYDPRRQVLPRRITDTEQKLAAFLNGNGYSEFFDREKKEYEYQEVFSASWREQDFRRVPVEKTIKGKPIPKEVLRVAAESFGLKPKFLFPPTVKEKPLATKARNSYLVVIAALLKQSKIDPSSKGVENAIELIVSQAGLKLSSKKIKQILDEIPDAVSSRSE